MLARDGAFRLSTRKSTPQAGVRFHFRVHSAIGRHYPRIMLFGQ